MDREEFEREIIQNDRVKEGSCKVVKRHEGGVTLNPCEYAVASPGRNLSAPRILLFPSTEDAVEYVNDVSAFECDYDEEMLADIGIYIADADAENVKDGVHTTAKFERLQKCQ